MGNDEAVCSLLFNNIVMSVKTVTKGRHVLKVKMAAGLRWTTAIWGGPKWLMMVNFIINNNNLKISKIVTINAYFK